MFAYRVSNKRNIKIIQFFPLKSSLLRIPNKHERLAQCCFNTGPSSATLAQHYTNTGPISHVWVFITDLSFLTVSKQRRGSWHTFNFDSFDWLLSRCDPNHATRDPADPKWHHVAWSPRYTRNHINPIINNLNFHPFEVVSRYRDPQLQVGEKIPFLLNLKPNISNSWCLSIYFIRNNSDLIGQQDKFKTPIVVPSAIRVTMVTDFSWILSQFSYDIFTA